MGLDNIPREYPCRRQGTAIMRKDEEMNEEIIDCRATIDAKQCPWYNAMPGRGRPVVPLLGAPCWFRGKAGNYMLHELEEAGFMVEDFGFYGDGYAKPNLTPGYCVGLATFMENHVEAYASLHKKDEDGGKNAIEEYRYAAWWLRWVAAEAGGADAWY